MLLEVVMYIGGLPPMFRPAIRHTGFLSSHLRVHWRGARESAMSKTPPKDVQIGESSSVRQRSA